MYEFDDRLKALAGCPVIEDVNGSVVFDPNPVIIAESDQVLSHEICHVLGGRADYEIFATANVARKNELYRHVLNMLYDWYHEYLYGKHSSFLWEKLTELHKRYTYQHTDIDALDFLNRLYLNRKINPKSHNIKDVIDLVAYADKLLDNILEDAADCSGLFIKDYSDFDGQFSRSIFRLFYFIGPEKWAKILEFLTTKSSAIETPNSGVFG